jgi:hypothetical protein
MNITRNNYEEYFVLYIDNELTAAQREAVEAFVDQNTDLKGELEMLQQTILPPEEPITFLNKEMLFRKEEHQIQQLVNTRNCEEYFVLYSDNELKNDENALVEEFVYRHPEYQEAFELIQQVRYSPDRSVVFPDKSVLYRSENDVKVVPMFRKMRFWKMAAAAVVMIMISGTAWFAIQRSTENNNTSALAQQNQPAGQGPSANSTSTEGTTASPQSTVNAPGKINEAANETANLLQSNANRSESVPEDGSGTGKSVSSPHKTTNTGSGLTDVKQNKSVEAVTDNSRTPQIDVAQNAVKKVNNQSNIPVTQNVEQEKAKSNKAELKMPPVDAQKTPDETMAATLTQKSVETSNTAIGPVPLKKDNVFANLANENDEEFEQSDKKNKMRGFFRKVTRVFDKATSREPSENRKGIHIASFAIDLK